MKFRTHNDRELGKVMDELHLQIRDAQNKQMVLWEEKLKLHVNPKPRWMPIGVWAKLINIVITQSSQRKFLAGSQEMPKEVLDANTQNSRSS